MDHTIIIAEIGECFNGDMRAAHRLIEVAKEAGCDYAKFQTLDPRKVAEDDPEREWFLRIALTEDRIDTLIEYGRQIGIPVFFTPENEETAAWLFERELQTVKLASSSLVDTSLLDYVNGRFDTVFLSTGMGSLDEINQAISRLDEVPNLCILHCISEYPTGALLEQRGLQALAHKDMRLNMMKMLMQLFPQHRVGYSDHTVSILAPVIAVAAGAAIIEKHITLDRQAPIANYLEGEEYLGTDHVLSLEPEELKEMVRQIREVETMFGPWHWERSDGEKILMKFLRERFQPQRRESVE